MLEQSRIVYFLVEIKQQFCGLPSLTPGPQGYLRAGALKNNCCLLKALLHLAQKKQKPSAGEREV